MSAPEPTQSVTEEDAFVWLTYAARDHEPGMRRTDDVWPETFWELADKVAEQREVRQEDADRLSAIYEDWQNAQNEEDAMSGDAEA